MGYILNMTGHERDAFRVYGISAILNVIAVFVGIQFGGIVGAAIASSITIVTWNVWLHALSVRHLDIHPSILSIVGYRRQQRDRNSNSNTRDNDDTRHGGLH